MFPSSRSGSCQASGKDWKMIGFELHLQMEPRHGIHNPPIDWIVRGRQQEGPIICIGQEPELPEDLQSAMEMGLRGLEVPSKELQADEDYTSDQCNTHRGSVLSR